MSDWSHHKIGDLLTLEYGKALPDRDRDGEGAPVYGSNGIVGFHSEPLVSGPAIIVGRKGTAGSVHWSEADCFPIDTTYYVRLKPRTGLSLPFAYWLLTHADLPRITNKTGVPGLNRERVYEQPVSLPPSDSMDRILTALEANANAVSAARAYSEELVLLGRSLQERLLTPPQVA